MPNPLIIRHLGRQPYQPIWQAMKDFTQQRNSDTDDELWLLEHEPVFTQGQAGKAEHILNPHNIPVVHSDRGGQVTYHGPGQLMAYTLIDIKRQQLGIRSLVNGLEQTVIDLLATLDIAGERRDKAPGIYVKQHKICSIGLRVRRGYSYHGIALNYKLDLTPFSFINPCGFTDLRMTQISEFEPNLAFSSLKQQFISTFCQQFGYTVSAQHNGVPYEPATTV